MNYFQQVNVHKSFLLQLKTSGRFLLNKYINTTFLNIIHEFIEKKERNHEQNNLVKSENWSAAYGTHIIIESKDPNGKIIRHLYAHLSKRLANVDASVKAGQSTGLHLHYEERVSPFAYANHRTPRFNK
jgi:hypothetical protein